jgi:hypothetical protein
MLRILGVSGIHPLALLPVGAILIGAGLWQHLTVLTLVGAYLVIRGAVGAATAGRSGGDDRRREA